MKKALSTALATATTLSLATPAFAQTDIDPCGNVGNPWNRLCLLQGSDFGTVIGNAILTVFIIATIIALFFLIWGGVKWIVSGGDKAKVDAARSTIIAALVGLVITFLSYFILQVVLGMFGISFANLTLPKLFP